MHLCTLHPSLSALALNLELNRNAQLAFGALDSALAHKLKIKSDNSLYFRPVPDTNINNQESYQTLDLVAVNEIISGLEPDSLCLGLEAFNDPKPFLPVLNALESRNIQNTNLDLHTLSQIFSYWEELGKCFGKQGRARDLHQRAEAQLMDWVSNFYARIKGKRVVVLSQLNPLTVASSWINDAIRRIGAIAPELEAEADQILIGWDFLAKFDPHILILAPVGKDLISSAKLFFELEKLPKKEGEILSSLPACKRGDIYFAPGLSSFYSLDYRIIDSLGLLVSAISGFDSGYITERDSFYKLRFLELHRHKFAG